MSTAEHQPLDTEALPTVSASEARIAEDAPRALRYLARVGALDVAPMLGLGVAS